MLKLVGDERAVDTLGSDMLLLGVNSGVIMSADMGTFRVDVEIENPANPGTLLGARTLEGLNFRIEPVARQLVEAGPAPAAVA